MSEARARLLQTGVDVLHELGVRPGVEHVRLADVARRAGYATSAAYRCWPTQADFHRDLAIAAVAWRDRPLIADTTRMVRALVSGHAPLLEVLRVGANSNVHRRPEEVEFYTALALRACAGNQPELRLAAADRAAEGLQAHAELFGVLLEVYGREIRPPFTLEHLTATIAALADGYAIQDITGEHHPHVDRGDLGDGVGTDWTLFACVLEVVVSGMTQQRPGL